MVREECPVCKRNGKSNTCPVCGGGNEVYKTPVNNTSIWKYWMADMVDVEGHLKRDETPPN